jgi:hypothetical protein
MADDTTDTGSDTAETSTADTSDDTTLAVVEEAEASAAHATELAESAKWKALSRKHERAARQALRELDEVKAQGTATVDQVRSEAFEAGKAEAMGEANRRMVAAAVLSTAAPLFADPSDAVAFVNTDAITVGDDGTVDGAAVAQAVAAVLEAKPHLAAGKTPALPGAQSADTATTSMNDWIRRAAGMT